MNQIIILKTKKIKKIQIPVNHDFAYFLIVDDYSQKELNKEYSKENDTDSNFTLLLSNSQQIKS